MLKRKAMDQLEYWVKHKDKKCLVVQGARQTGKTWYKFKGCWSTKEGER